MSDGVEMAGTNAVHASAQQADRPTGDLRRNPVLLALVTGIIGPIFLVIGIVYTNKALAAREDYAHAHPMTARVVSAQYVKADRSQAETIVVAVNGSGEKAMIDDVTSAPDYLVPGQTVEVLMSSTRPGHALFARQLNGSKLMLPIGAIVAGVGALGAFVWSVVGTRRLIPNQRQS
ncbi:hypothetical protein [Streptacidiphilus melanogenes]|uniref:hypothetical protein n=1 Tax=Streptacidiphilus melanogenes TaxID=411235 RepID=UPI00126A3682|nr:hypothetical protein [Streptacidiphilus melanogenes]